MESSHLPEGAGRVVERTFVSRAAVEAFFQYCREARRLQQDGDQPPRGKKRLLH
jgi:hypothetical protein